MKPARSASPRWPLKPRSRNDENEQRRRFLFLGFLISGAVHLLVFAYVNVMATVPANSEARFRPATEVELVAKAPEPEIPPPRPPPQRLIARAPKIEGVPQPKPNKIEPPAPIPTQAPPAQENPTNPTVATAEPSPQAAGPGDMVSPIPATGGVASNSPVTGSVSSGTSVSGTTLASKGNASFTSAAPDYLHNPPPEYPEDARLNRQQGMVLLLVDVSPDGAVLNVKLERSSGYRKLDEAALRVAKNWKFKPATMGGQTVRSQVEVPIRFKLQ